MREEKIKKEEKIEKKEFTPFERKLKLEARGGEPSKIGCPVCGDTENLVPSGRCVTCLSCGWSKCSL